MRRTFRRFSLVFAVTTCLSTKLLADVAVTEPTGGQNISADKAVDSTNGAAFSSLGNIVITEGSNTDFAIGNNQTLILTAPANWRFNAGVGSVSFLSRADITAAGIAVTASNLTVTFSVGGTTKSDSLTISGVQVQPLDGVIDIFADSSIRRVSENPGTSVIAGIENDFTTFGQLSVSAGAARVLAMQTQPAATATAGSQFAPQPEVKVLDQFGNFRDIDGTTVVTAVRASGAGTLQGTLSRTAQFGIISYTNLSLNSTGTITIQFTGTNLTSVTSDPIVVGPAVADRLVFTSQPSAAVAGAPFGVQPVLKTRDPFGSDSTVGLAASQLVTVALTSGTGTLLGVTTFDIGTNAGNGVVTFTNLQLNLAGTNKQLTATSSGFLSGTSGSFAVTAGAFTQLQLLAPGETAAPGTVSGKSGSPTAQAATVAFNVTVNAADVFWNLVTNVTHTVGITSSDTLATLPANAALVAGTRSFSVTLKTLGNPTVTASDLTDGTKSPSASAPIPVSSGPPAKLTVQTQPSATAAAGSAFAQQPVIRVEDSAGNLVTSDNGRVITASRSAGTSTLQGTLTATTVNGVATFANLSYNVAEAITLNFAAAGLTNAISSNIVVHATTADHLAFTTQPGGVSRIGSPLATQPVIRSRDQFENDSAVGLPANLPLAIALSAGSGSLLGTTILDIGTAAGNGTAAFTNVQCSAAGTNQQLTASAAGFTSAVSAVFTVGGVGRATVGGAISADTTGGAYTTVSGPAYYEAASADVKTGTIILNAPAGFVFDAAGTPAPTVLVTRLTGSGANTNNINGLASGTAAAITSRTTNQITFTVSAASSNGVTCALTWQNVRVRPSAGTPLASGDLTKTGTSVMQSVTNSTTVFGTLNEVVGVANQLGFFTQPGGATAGAPFGIQPIIRTRDQFGNDSVTGLPASKIVSMTLTSGAGPLLGTTNLDIGTAAGNGQIAFNDLEIDSTTTTKQLTASASGFTNAVSSFFTVLPAAASRLTIQTQPSPAATAGVTFAQQPVIRIEDQFGNLRSADNGAVVTTTRNGGSGVLQGTTSATVVNGVATFANLSHTVANTITIDFASPGLAGATSSNVVVSAAAATRLTIQTQPSPTAIAGVAFAQQPVIRIEDQFGNLRSADNSTIVNAARSAGTGTLQGTSNRTAVGGVVSFTDLSHTVATNITVLFTSGSLTNTTSTGIAVSPAAASQLGFATQPGNATAGSAFSTQPVMKARDAFGNDSTVGLAANQDVTMNLTGGSGPLQGDTIVDIGTAAGNGSASFTDLRIDAAGSNKQLTASASGLSSASSAIFTVNPAAFTKLQLLVPGETAAPATVAGKTGAPTPQSATVPFNVTVNAVDAYWNLVNTVTHSVSITSSDALATLPANAALVAGAKSFSVTLKSLGNLTVTASDITDGTKAANTSPPITVNSGPAAKLTIQTQPSSAATAGAAFGQQPVVRVEDSAGNLVAGDNGRVLTVARGTGTGTLQGTLTATTVNGVATFAGLFYNVAETITLSFTASGVTGVASSNVVVSATTADRLAFTTQPGGVSRIGAALATQPALKTSDQFGNASVVGLPANLSLTLALTAGSGSILGTTNLNIGTAGSNGVVTFTSVQCTDAGTNKQLTASAPGLANAVSAVFLVGGADRTTNGSAVSADTTGGTYTTLLGPTYFEAAPADVGTGTIILNAPAGFVFDSSGSPAPTVLITRITGTNGTANNINGVTNGTAAAITSRTTTQITFTVSSVSGGGVTCALTWQNVRVRPSAGTPLASGNLTKTGTSTMASVTASNTSFGTLTELAGLSSSLAFTTQPGTNTAGSLFATLPVVRTRDQFGNDSTTGLAASKTVSLALTAGTGPLLGTTNLDIGTAAGNGVVTFSNLEIDSAGTNKQLTASSPGSSNGVSSVFTVNAGAASKLTMQTQPSASATAGAAFAQQPSIRVEDAFGNLRSSDNTTVVTVARADGTGALLGTTTRTAVNGVITFTNLSYNVAETITLGFASSGLTGATSSSVVVSPAAANRLTIQTQPSATATAGVPFAQQPVVRIEDQFGNLRSADNATIVTAARAAGSGALQGATNVTAIGGVVSFASLAHTVATNITILFTSGTLSNATSTTMAVSPAAANKLTMQTQPSTTATAGVAFAQQPAVRIEDSFGNRISSDNSTVVTASRAAGSGTLQGALTATAINGVATFANLSHNVATNITIQFANGGLSNTTSSTIAVGAAAADHLAIQTQPASSATAGVAFSPQPVIRIEDVFGNLRTGDNSTVVTASRATGTGTLQGTTSRTTAGGVVTYTNLSYNVAETITINFSGGGLPVVTSGGVAVSPAAANKLTIQTQPSSAATAGVPFAPQPVIRIEDAFGNLRSTDNSTAVTAARSAGAGTLQGTTSATAVNGVVSFANLSHNVATNITIQFASGSLSNATSTMIAVSPTAASQLTIQTQPSPTATAGVAFTNQPVIWIADAFGNRISGDNSTVVTATRADGGGNLQGTTNLTAVGGVVTFTNLAHLVATNITIQFTGGSLASATSSVVAVHAGSPVQLTLQTQPAPTAIAGVPFNSQPVICVLDQYSNLCDVTVSVTASRNAGSGTLQGNLTIPCQGGLAYFTNLAHNVATTISINFASGSLTPATSDPIVVGPAAASRLTLQTQPSATATAGVVFAQQPAVRIEDSLGNLITTDSSTVVTATRGAGSGTLQGTVAVTAVNGVATFMNLSHNVATNITIQFNGGSLTGATSGTIAVSPAAANHFTIQTQPSSSATAGAAFAQQPVIRIEDAFGNLRSSDGTTVVTAGRATGTATLQGTTSRVAAGGVATFTNLSYNAAETITIAFTGGSLPAVTSGSVAVSAAAASRLTIQTQPSATATAGVAFPQQPVIRIEDQLGNLRTADNATVVTVTCLAGSGTLQGTTNVTAANGVVTFAGLSHLVANTITIQFTSGSLSSATSSAITVNPGAFAKLQLLAPGETAAPGTATGKTGTPAAQIVGTTFNATVNAVDANWNLVSTVSDTVSLASSDAAATLPANAALATGARTFTMNFNTSGAATVTASDVSDGSKTPSTSPVITVAAAPFTPASGGGAISADATGGTYTNLTGPVYTEAASGNVGTGTVILNAPAGFVFDTGGTAPTVRINGGTTSKNINGVANGSSAAMSSVTSTQLTFTVTSPSSGGTLCTMTWQNVRVRPTAGTPLATGNLAVGGTAVVVGVSTNSNFGTLNEVVGGARKLVMQTQPSATATAGVTFPQQPILQVQDQFGNFRANDSTTVVSAGRSAGSGPLQGTTNGTALAGIVTFTNLSHNVATNITVLFSSPGLTNVTSSTIAVSPATATALAFTTQPANATAGAAFGTQPVVKSYDAFGNISMVGLPANLPVAVALASGTGPLQGTTSVDLGTAAGNGTGSFNGLRIDAAGTNKQLTASASGLGSVASSTFIVSPAAASKLTIQTQPPSTATAGTAFAPQPVVRIEDAFGNLRMTDNTTIVTAARNVGTGALQGTTTVTASGGIASFASLSYTVAETMNMSFTSGGLTGAASSDVTVNAAAANKLTILTQPSSTATAGVTFAQQPVIRVEDQFGNLRSTDNTTVVTATRSAGTGALQGGTGVPAVNGVVSFANLSYPVAETMKIGFNSGSLSNATSANVVVRAGAFTKLQVLAPGETAAPGAASGKTGTPNAQIPGTAFSVTVNAVDDNWNLANTVTDLVAITSSDVLATLPANAALQAGTKQFSVTLNSIGTNTITGSDMTDGSKAAGVSGGIPVNARFTPAVGGSAISADTTGGAFTSLTGPSYLEFASGDVGTGTIVLNAPSGFIFDTNAPAPTVLITRLAGSGGNTNNLNDVASGTATAMTSVTTTQMTFTVTGASALGVTCGLTWQNVRVRPTAGAPLAVTNLIKTGTSVMTGVTNSVSNFGALREIAGAANRLAIQTQPASTAIAGAAFAQQPLICVKDQFGNLRSTANGSADNSTAVTATRIAGSGALQGATNLSAVDGLIAFTNLSHLVATNITIQFTSGSLVSTTSTSIAVSPAAATKLVFATQPANGVVGGILGTQPVVRSCDVFGNNSSANLGASKVVTLTLSSGPGSLVGTTALDIGTGAGNGAVSFTNLGTDSAGTNMQLTASANGLSDAVSSVFSVGKGSQTITFGALAGKTYGDAAFTLNATASSGLPVSFSVVSGPASMSGSTLTITGAGAVTVRASQPGDANWNAAATVDRSFAVAKAALTITADNKTRSYGVTNPPLTVSYSGFVNGDGAGVLSGSPSLSTTATPTSPVSGSPYPITVTAGTLISTNYNFTFINGSLTVGKATLTIAANDKSRVYGAANPPLTFTIAGFVNGEGTNVLSGNPTLNTAATVNSSVPGSPYAITVAQGTLSASNYTWLFLDGALSITKATLTVAANDQSRVYGAPDPTFTANFSGFVNGENTNVLGGNPAFAALATATSPVAGSPYPITAGLGTLNAANYSFAFVPGQLTITPASLVSLVTSSANPSPTGSNVTFTATLTAVSPSVGVPVGNVRFTADGSPLGSPVSLSGSAANLTTESLSHGTHTITAEYATDGNFFGVTNSLNASQIIDSAPLAALATYTRSSNFWVKIPIMDLITNYTSDADGDARTLLYLGSGTNGATIFVYGDGIYYLPSDSDPNRNSPDYFDYTVTDGFAGCLVTNKICVRVRTIIGTAPEPPAKLTGIAVVAGGMEITFKGSPNTTYHVFRAMELPCADADWVELGPATTDETGMAQIVDDKPPATQAFYRVASP